MPEDFARVLAEFGVSPVEYDAFTCPYYCIPLGLKKMASWTVLELYGCRDTFSADDYCAALKGMIFKGWLSIQSGPSAERERDKAGGFPSPIGEPLVPSPDVVTFTRRGYLLHRRLLRRKHGQDFVRRVDTLELDDEDACELRFYARSELECRDWMEAQRGRDHSSHIEILSATGPEPTGPWRPSRFRLIRRGYLETARYRRTSDVQTTLTFQIAEHAFKAEVLSQSPAMIRRSINDLRFQFVASTYAPSAFQRSPQYDCWEFVVFEWTNHVVPGSILTGEREPAGYRRGRLLVFHQTGPRRNDSAQPLNIEDACRIIENCLRAYFDPRNRSEPTGDEVK